MSPEPLWSPDYLIQGPSPKTASKSILHENVLILSFLFQLCNNRRQKRTVVDQVRSKNIFNHTIWFWRANDLCVVRTKVSKCEWRRTVLFYTKRAACFILLLQKAVKRRRCGGNLIWSFEFIFSLYDLTSSSIETAIRGREKDDKTWDSYCTNTNQIQWTGNEIIISRSAVQVVINLKLRSYCLVSCPNPSCSPGWSHFQWFIPFMSYLSHASPVFIPPSSWASSSLAVSSILAWSDLSLLHFPSIFLYSFFSLVTTPKVRWLTHNIFCLG